jgi:hypothetical protein
MEAFPVAQDDQDHNTRDQFCDHPNCEVCVKFCARWDQVPFDLSYRSRPLEYFIPLVESLFCGPHESLVCRRSSQRRGIDNDAYQRVPVAFKPIDPQWLH